WHSLAGGYVSLGTLYSQMGQAAESEKAFRAAEEVLTKPGGVALDRTDQRLLLAKTRGALANLLLGQGRHRGAEGPCRAAAQTFEGLALEHPESSALQTNMGLGWLNLAKLYAGTRQLREAAVHYRKAEAVFAALAKQHPSTIHYQSLLGLCHVGLGHVYA